ncbi:MAG: STAS domain-containing protein [Blautia sp.]|nr:STAS domain-containing protein [Blautia sp.]
MSTTIFEKNGAVLNVKPEGRLDTATSPALEEEVRAQMDGVREIIMDFSDVEYISSGGLRVLLALEQTLESQDGGLRLIHVNDNILEIFELVGFMEVISVNEA